MRRGLITFYNRHPFFLEHGLAFSFLHHHSQISHNLISHTLTIVTPSHPHPLTLRWSMRFPISISFTSLWVELTFDLRPSPTPSPTPRPTAAARRREERRRQTTTPRPVIPLLLLLERTHHMHTHMCIHTNECTQT